MEKFVTFGLVTKTWHTVCRNIQQWLPYLSFLPPAGVATMLALVNTVVLVVLRGAGWVSTRTLMLCSCGQKGKTWQ